MGFCKRKGVECDIFSSASLAQCLLTGCFKGLPDVPRIDKPCITGVVDTETEGKNFAIGTKNQATGFVLNFGNKSCLLFTGDVMPIDLRKFNFDEFESIEINGNRFVREVKE